MAAYVFGPAAARDKTGVLLVAEADPNGIVPGAPEGPLDAILDSYLVVAARDGGLSVPVEKEVQVGVPASARARLEATWLPLFRELELPPGAYQARLLLRDRKTGRVGTVRHNFTVPPDGMLRSSTPILTDCLQGDPKTGTSRPVPVARRAFASGANLAYVFEVYGAQADPSGPRVTSTYEVRRADGSSVVTGGPSPIQPGPQGQLGAQVPLSLQGASPGDYAIVLTIQDEVAGQRLQVVDPFAITPPPAVGSAPVRP